MTTKSVTYDTDTGDQQIVTTNGVTTTTTAFYPFPVHVPRYTEYGVDEALFETVLDQIRENPETWNQDVWRMLFTNKTEFERAVNEGVLFTGQAYSRLPEPVQRCGASMCTAGWAVEVARADWLVDRSLALSFADANGFMDLVLVPVADLAPVKGLATFGQLSLSDTNTLTLELLPPAAIDSLRTRGFLPADPQAPATHRYVTAGKYASVLLGIGNDALGIFSGNLSLEWIELYADLYIRYGPSMPSDLTDFLYEVRESFTSSAAALVTQLRNEWLAPVSA